jgi:hypothetical protein
LNCLTGPLSGFSLGCRLDGGSSRVRGGRDTWADVLPQVLSWGILSFWPHRKAPCFAKLSLTRKCHSVQSSRLATSVRFWHLTSGFASDNATFALSQVHPRQASVSYFWLNCANGDKTFWCLIIQDV